MAYHPLLFFLIGAVAAAELGLTAYLIYQYENVIHAYPSPRYRSLIILMLFNACWTFLFAFAYIMFITGGALHFLGSIGGSALWLVVTAILWGVGAGLFHDVRGGSDCTGDPPISMCRNTLTVEALGWTELGLCIVTLFAACFWVSRSRRSYRDAYYV